MLEKTLMILIGVMLIVLSGPISKLGIKNQNEALGYKFGAKEAKASQVVIIIVALGFIGIAILRMPQT